MKKEEILQVLETRFKNNLLRHPNITWKEILKRLSNKTLDTIIYMEETGGEPDLVQLDNKYYYVDFSKETPDRKNVCYDEKARLGRSKFPPKTSAIEIANQYDAELLTEKEYKDLQRLEKFDTKTSSWIQTPEEVRNLGGAIFGDNRYNQVFIYHNGADSYYNNRGFRIKYQI